jgi:hypothetical protein
VRPHVADQARTTFPEKLRACETRLIDERRERIGSCHKILDQVVGLALSGGGARSATFNLGFLQALAQHHVLRTVDYLSTVSGGGYIGSFLGRFYTRFINRPAGAADLIEARLNDASSPEISWLRRCSGYMTVLGSSNAPMTTAVMLRSFLTVHVIIGALLVAGFNVANLVRYAVIEWILDHLRPWVSDATKLSLPVDLVPSSVDPWMLVLAVVVVVGFLPLAIAYWLPSLSKPESYERTRLVAFMIVSATGFVMAAEEGAWAVALGVFVTTMMTFVWVREAWTRVALKTPAATGRPAGRAMVRVKLDKWLAIAIAIAVILLGIWVLDDIVFRHYPPSMPLRDALVVMCLTFAFLFGPLRWLALWLFTGATAQGRKRGPVRRVLTSPFLFPAASGVLLLIQWDFISHAMFHRGADVGAGFVWTVVSLAISGILGGASGIALVNSSSLRVLYAARGSRTYLGASNPYRHETDDGGDVTSPQPEDDIPFDHYRPDLAGGPLHLINVFANQSIDRASGRRTSDRQGENMAVGPCGVSVGVDSHGEWVAEEGRDDVRSRLRAVGIGDLPAAFRPRCDSQECSDVVQTSVMQLSDWMSISGSAFSPGEFADTRLGTSLIYGLANVRAGFWWDSGIEDGDRLGEPIPTFRQRFRRAIVRRVRMQSFLRAELTGRFAGPWRRYWYLSDGGSADDLGIYELVRRRVPIIICADATRDVDGELAALGNTMRRIHIDFGAEIEFLSPAALQTVRGVPHSVLNAIGTLDDVRFSRSSDSRKHAAVAGIRYSGTGAQGALLYVKATVTGDEPVDVLEYRRQHHRFPQQSVLDQSLDEAQWESYRELGHHSGDPLFSEGPEWLADVLHALPQLYKSANGNV